MGFLTFIAGVVVGALVGAAYALYMGYTGDDFWNCVGVGAFWGMLASAAIWTV